MSDYCINSQRDCINCGYALRVCKDDFGEGQVVGCQLNPILVKEIRKSKGGIKMKEKTPVELLAEATNRTTATIYYIARKLGRLPTKEEVLSQKQGRPRKY